MKNHLLVLCFLCFGSVFSQNSLEDRIYEATDVFNNIKSAEALNTLNNAIIIFEAQLSTTDDYYAFVNLLANKAHYLKAVNKNTQAIKSYEKAWQLYNKKVASVYQFNIIDFCLIPLGVLYNKIGDYTAAENIIKTYISIAEKDKNNTQRVAGSINLSRLYQTIGRHQLAIDIANYELNTKQANTQQKSKLKYIKSRSEIRLNKKVRFTDNGGIVLNPKTQSIEELELAYEIAFQKKDYTLALKIFKNLKSLKTNKLSSANNLSKIYIAEAQLNLLLEQPKEAEKNLKTALKTLLINYDSNVFPVETDLYPDNAFIGIFDLFAEIQTDPKKTIAYYNLSFYVSDLLTQNVTAQEGKLILLSEKRKRSEKSLDILHYLQNTSNDSKYTLEALQLSERYKASILKEMVGKKELLKIHPNDTLLITQQTLLKTQEQLTNKLIRTPYSNFNETQKLKLREKLSSINIELKKLKTKIETSYPITPESSLNISKLNSKLQTDQATLVNYFYGKNAIYQIIVSDKTTAFNKISLNETNTQTIKNFIKYFDSPSAINNNISKFTKDAHLLYNLLKLDEVKDKKNLIIIPDGFLNFIPFDALLTTKTESKTFENMPFFVKSHVAVFNSNVSLYLKDTSTKKEQRILGVFPVFKGTSQELAYSIVEAENLEKEIETTLLMNTDATKSRFLSEAKNYSILHLSTHGTSGDFFKPAQIAFIDEPISTNELYSIDLNPELVVLSACETGVGEIKRGEGALSIARGFQYAGAKKVLYSLWQISDLSTSQIMTLFYKRLDDSKSISYANQQSKLDYLNNGDIKNLKKSPYYWSAFTLYGSFDKIKESNNLGLFIGVSLVIILLLLWLFKQKNGKRTLGISPQKRI
ncbi:CHAT domain-containing protein [Lacinutrix sp. Bg11-31]|uniref:CHAT domain-containing protein n=1 Tax=Lacinutrix sp. Bg11-31 TaxID=2057808 RepID=UPI000C301628|nr:CHAT domain-containing protein [Lacinutrix sp. Bg11-31]AUC83208.1 CHAT domain-containing protein [Lacinutrix sp. Bg11-31]